MITLTDYTAIVLVRKEPFYLWLKTANQKALVDDDNFYVGDHWTYLFAGLLPKEKWNDFLERNCTLLFENELNEWHEPHLWPESRGLETFLDFFDVQINSQVYTIDNTKS